MVTPTTAIYAYCLSLSLHDALPICFPRDASHLAPRSPPRLERRPPALPAGPGTDRLRSPASRVRRRAARPGHRRSIGGFRLRSEEHTSELQSLMSISYAVFCLKHTNKKEHQL